MHSLNDYKSVFCSPTKFVGIWGLLIYRCQGLENTFSTVYYMPQFFFKSVVKQERKICNHLVTANHGGQKNRNRQSTAVLFYHVFY